MTPSKMAFMMAIGLSAGACTSYSNTTTTVPAAPSQAVVVQGGSEQACLDYGFVAGTGPYAQCVSREHEARLRGRVAPTYSEAQLTDDARGACSSYGLLPGTGPYDRCVGREIDARHYRGDTTATVYTPTPGYTAVTTYSTTTSYPAPSYDAPRNDPPAGVQAFHDEYNFRYDGQGNRLDRNGNIISPQSTQP